MTAAGARALGASSDGAVQQAGATTTSLGERLRVLRLEAGLTQSELAASRVSKEYVSQLERDKTRPSKAMLEWLAQRLGTDATYLAEGITAGEYEAIVAALESAEALARDHDDVGALEAFRAAAAPIDHAVAPELALRRTRGEIWSLLELGRLDEAETLLEAAETRLAPGRASELDRADLDFRRGVCRYRQSRIDEAVESFDRALLVAEASALPSQGLRSDIYHWRSRCFRRHSDWAAAHADIDRAIELAQDVADERRAALAYFQASLVAEREGRWILARTHAETAKELFEQLGDRANVGRLLNNIGGLNHLLGNSESAIVQLRESYLAAVETGLEPDAGHVMCSLAEILLDQGDVDAAAEHARKALELLAGRSDYRHEIGIAQLTLGKALLSLGELEEAQSFLDAAADTFASIDSTSHQATAWIAQGDLLERQGDAREAAEAFRRAAVALQDTSVLL